MFKMINDKVMMIETLMKESDLDEMFKGLERFGSFVAVKKKDSDLYQGLFLLNNPVPVIKVSKAAFEDRSTFTYLESDSNFQEVLETINDEDFFKRCDKCNVKHDRSKVYILSDSSVVGGSCAKSSGYLEVYKKLDIIQTNLSQYDYDIINRKPTCHDMDISIPMFIVRSNGFIGGGFTLRECKSLYDLVKEDLTLNRKDKAPILEEYFEYLKRFDGQAREDLENFLEGLDTSVDFNYKMRYAYDTKEANTLGVFCYVPAAYNRDMLRKARESNMLWKIEENTLEGVIKDVGSVERFCELYGVKESSVKRGLNGKPSKALQTIVRKTILGKWDFIGTRSFASDFGWCFFNAIKRVSDGKIMTIKTSYTFEIQNESFRVLRYTLKDDHPTYGVTVNRVKLK